MIVAAGGNAFVFGHSSGAVLALEAAHSYPDRISRLALYEPPFIVDDSRPPLPADFVTRLEELVSSGRRGDAVEYFLTTGPGVPPEVVSGMRARALLAVLRSGRAHTRLRRHRHGRHDGRQPRAAPSDGPRWRCPRSIMDGGASPEWQRNAVRALSEVLPDARHRTLEGQGHGADPKVLAPALGGVLPRLTSRATLRDVCRPHV